MKIKWLQAGVAAAIVVLANGAGAGEEVNAILAKIQKANDPNGIIGTIKTEIVQSKVKVDSTREGTLTIHLQYPNKMRMDAEGKDGRLIRIFDGEKGWQYTAKDGRREITGAELASMKFQVQLAMPDTNFKEIFEKIELDGEETVRGQACYRLNCTPKAEFQMPPMIVLVDQQTGLVAKTSEQHNLKDGLVEITKTFDAYEDFAGIMIPTSIISETNTKLIDLSVESVSWNEEIDPSVFTMPQDIGQ